MAGTLTVSPLTREVTAENIALRALSMAFTSHTDGTVSANTAYVPPGFIHSIEVRPATSGTQPTNLFDLTLLTADGYDLLEAKGADLINTGPTLLRFATPVAWMGGLITPTIAGAGSGKTGTIVLVLR